MVRRVHGKAQREQVDWGKGGVSERPRHPGHRWPLLPLGSQGGGREEYWPLEQQRSRGGEARRDSTGSSKLWTLGQKGLFTQRPTRSRPRPRVNY